MSMCFLRGSGHDGGVFRVEKVQRVQEPSRILLALLCLQRIHLQSQENGPAVLQRQLLGSSSARRASQRSMGGRAKVADGSRGGPEGPF